MTAALRFESRAPEATEALGEALGRALGPGAVLALVGPLGAGKTALVRGLARGLGAPDEVASPTYTLRHEYPGRLTLHHFDAYLAGRGEAHLAEGGEEWLEGAGCAAIEWADQVDAWLPRPHLRLELDHRAPEVRRITARAVGEPDGGLAGAWAALAALHADPAPGLVALPGEPPAAPRVPEGT